MVFDLIQLNLSDCKIKTLFKKVLKRTFLRTKTQVIGFIFALTSTTDSIRRNTTQPIRLQDKTFVWESFKSKIVSNKNISYRFDFCFNVNH